LGRGRDSASGAPGARPVHDLVRQGLRRRPAGRAALSALMPVVGGGHTQMVSGQLSTPPNPCPACPLPPTTFTRIDGQTTRYVREFSGDPAASYLLIGQDDGQEKYRAEIKLNGETYVSRTALRGLEVQEIKRAVPLRASNRLTVPPLGKAGAKVTAWISGPGPASPVVLYSSFGPGDTYDGSSGWTISSNGNGVYSQALQFTTSLSGSVETMEVALFRLQGGNQVTGTIMADAGGLPGSVLETFTFVRPSILLATSSAHSLPQARTPYWFVLTAGDLINDLFGWNRNVNPPFVPNAQRVGSGPWVLDSPDYRGNLRVTGVTTP